MDVTAQNAVFDQHVLLTGVALVVHVERAPAVRNGAVVQHGDALGGHALTDAAAEGARALAVEVTLQTVPNRFVQQNAGPSAAQHHGHLACGRRKCLQVDERSRHRFLHISLDHGIVKIGQTKAATATRAAHFAAAVLLGDHRDRQANQRAHIGGQCAVGSCHHDHVVLGGQTGHDLYDARVFGTSDGLDTAQQIDLGCAVQSGHRVERGIKRAAGRNFACRHLDALVLCGLRDGAHRHRGVHQGRFGDVVRVGKGGFLARNSPHTHALVDAEAASLDDAFFQAPALGAGVLKVQVGVVHLVRLDGGQRPTQVGFVQTEGLEQEGPGRGQAFNGGFA